LVQTRIGRGGVADFPRYGDVYDVELDPVVGSEIGKRRPALVVSNDVNNQYASTVTIIPITSQPPKRRFPFEVALPKGTAGLTADSRVKADHVRTVDKGRLRGFRGSLPPSYFPQVEAALKVHLNMK